MNKDNTLILCALESETDGRLDGYRVVYTGVGKTNTAYHLMKAIAEQRPTHVLDIGTAGSSIFNAGDMLCCTSFVQRDMDATPIGFKKYETPFGSDDPILIYGEKIAGYTEACCGSGDSFDTSHSTDVPWQLVEMEAYVAALICQREKIPFSCLKYISDGADGMAANDWPEALKTAAEKLSIAVKGICR